jgi:carboxylesterase
LAVPALGDPFELDGDRDVGVLCVHGFTGTPYDVRYLGGRLHEAGYTVHGLRLPGHGTQLADLDGVRWSDWADAVETAFERLRATRPRVAVVGQSLGGLLALHLATRRREVVAVASLAAPLWLEGLSGRVASWVERGGLASLKSLPKLAGSDVRDRRVRAESPSYRAIPVRALGELVRFMRIVGDELPQIQQPVLVLHSRRDHTAPVACAAKLADRTRAVRVRILERSFHLIATDVERDIVAAEVIDFLRRHVASTPGELACAM